MAKVLDLNACFPPGADGSRKPLPKQLEFLRSTLDPQPSSPKFIAYVGGIGSGKTLIGCITMLAMAVQYPGDYLIGRQYLPELKVTTLKTFLEICPPELVAEYRVADNLVKIKAVGGKLSTIFFRQLEEPDKFRSMNLSGFMIDECNQVSEEAFTLLQGRLRGHGLRKGILVSNPNGHDWVFRWFLQKDHLGEGAKQQYRLIRAPSTENVHLPDGYLSTLMQAWSKDRIAREIEGSFDAFDGAVYEEFRRDIHVIKPFRIPDEWPRYVGIDHGLRNPAAWVWVAIGKDGEAYVYREFYQSEWFIEEIVKGKRHTSVHREPGVLAMMNGERINGAYIDPSTKRREGSKGETPYDEYRRHLPQDFPLFMANNQIQLGIDRVKGYLKVNEKLRVPKLYIFETCKNLIEEMTQYRYPELRPNQEGRRAENEKPLKVNDHALDALRYVVVTLPDPYEEAIAKVTKWPTASDRLQEEIASYKKPTPKDPFGF